MTTTMLLCTAREQTEPAIPCQAGGSAASECGRAGFPSRHVPPLLRSFASGSTFPDSTTRVTLGKLIHEGHSSLQLKRPSLAQEYTCPTNKVSLRKLQVPIYEQHPLVPALLTPENRITHIPKAHTPPTRQEESMSHPLDNSNQVVNPKLINLSREGHSKQVRLQVCYSRLKKIDIPAGEMEGFAQAQQPASFGASESASDLVLKPD